MDILCFIIGICRHAYIEMVFSGFNNAISYRFDNFESCWQSCLSQVNFNCNTAEFVTYYNGRPSTRCNMGSIHTNDRQLELKPDEGNLKVEAVTLVRCVQL